MYICIYNSYVLCGLEIIYLNPDFNLSMMRILTIHFQKNFTVLLLLLKTITYNYELTSISTSFKLNKCIFFFWKKWQKSNILTKSKYLDKLRLIYYPHVQPFSKVHDILYGTIRRTCCNNFPGWKKRDHLYHYFVNFKLLIIIGKYICWIKI